MFAAMFSSIIRVWDIKRLHHCYVAQACGQTFACSVHCFLLLISDLSKDTLHRQREGEF